MNICMNEQICVCMYACIHAIFGLSLSSSSSSISSTDQYQSETNSLDNVTCIPPISQFIQHIQSFGGCNFWKKVHELPFTHSIYGNEHIQTWTVLTQNMIYLRTKSSICHVYVMVRCARLRFHNTGRRLRRQRSKTNKDTPLLTELLRFPKVRFKRNCMQVGTEYMANCTRVTHVCVQPIYSHQVS